MPIITPFTWTQYSTKIQRKLETLRSSGYFGEKDGLMRQLKVVIGKQGSMRDGNMLCLYWLVDEEDGVIRDAKFQAFGHTTLLAAADGACELLVGKNYDQAQRMSAELIDKHLRDHVDEPAFPDEGASHLNLVIDAISDGASQCEGIPLAETYVAPPAPMHGIEAVEGGYPGWEDLSLKQKLAVIEQVIASDIRPYIEMDAGGVEVLNLLNDREVIITYQGACTTCFSATGATLSYIQQVLRAKLSPELHVVPDMSALSL